MAAKQTFANTFVAEWVARLGVPFVITTDRGGQFHFHIWQQLVRLLGTKQIRTTAYHPIANGLVECFHHQLKVALKCQSIPEMWTNSLRMMLLGIRTALKNDLSELVKDNTLCLPAKFFHSSCSNTIDQVTHVTRLEEMMM